MTFPKNITVGKEAFSLVRVRRNKGAVYRGAHILRIGPKGEIAKEMSIHRTLARIGFPVARIVKSGRKADASFFIETSLGKSHLGSVFAEDYKKRGAISPKNFAIFLRVTKKFAEAQTRTARRTGSFAAFAKGVHFDYLYQEKMIAKRLIDRVVLKLQKCLAPLPSVLTHGDFTAHNMLKKGAIDFEDIFYGPAGYDLVSNIMQIAFFPRKNAEFIRTYEFSRAQQARYMRLVDAAFLRRGLPPPSSHFSDFAISRAVWSAVRMQKWPRVRAWRYGLLKKLFVRYLAGKDVRPLLK